MAHTKIRMIEAVYEQGLLRPLQPLEERPGQVYFVTIVDLAAIEKQVTTSKSWRGKYRGHLSHSDDFAQQKKTEKTLEQ